LGASLDPTLAEMRQAMTRSRAQTKEEIAKAHDDFAAKLATLKPAGNAYSRSWNEANAWVTQLSDAAASAPSGAVPADLFTPIEDHPLPVLPLDPAAFTEESFAFNSVRITPPKDARIDLKSFTTRDTAQRWSIGEAGTIELSVAPASDAKQQRPWI